jgi:hypothetical protein
VERPKQSEFQLRRAVKKSKCQKKSKAVEAEKENTKTREGKRQILLAPADGIRQTIPIVAAKVRKR